MLRRSTRILSIDRDDPDPRLIDEAARLVRAGGQLAPLARQALRLGEVECKEIVDDPAGL